MPYSKKELRALANDCAAQLGLEPISESVFESWITKELFEGACPHGIKRGINPSWKYPDDTETVVRKIVELKYQGADRTSQLLICLWVFGSDYPFKEIIEALKSEFGRIIKRECRRPPWWSYHYEDQNNLTETDRAKLVRRLPRLDPDLAATSLTLSQPVMFDVALRAYWGSDNGEMIPSIISHELARIMESPTDMLTNLADFLSISGAVGPPGESAIDGYQILDRISAADLETARSLIWFCFMGLVTGELFFSFFGIFPTNKLAVAYRKAKNSFLRPNWIIPSLALFAISAFHAPTANQPSK